MRSKTKADSHIISDKLLRRRAEYLIRTDVAETRELIPQAETHRLLHELQVHQIELELQNDELRQTQLELEASRERYFELFDMAPVGYVTLDRQGIVLECNFTVAKLLGVARNALVATSFSRYIFPDDRNNFYLQRNLLEESAVSQQCEIRMVRADGSNCWVELKVTLTANNECWIVANDISNIKRANELSKYAEQYQAMIATNLFGFWLVDATGRVLDVNDTYCRMSGYSKDELLLLSVADLEAAENPEETDRHIEKLIENGIDTFESRHRSKDGRIFDVEISTAYSRSQEEIIVFIRDISMRKELEFKFQNINKRLNYLISSSPAMIYTCKPSGNYGANYISSNVACQLGYQPEEFTEDPNLWASLIHPDDRERVLSSLSSLFDHDRHMHEYRFRHKDGSYRWMHDKSSLARNANGEPLELIGSWFDISERKQLEDELHLALENANSVNETMRRLLQVVGHEFRTPLGLLIGNTDILDRYWERLTPQKRFEHNERIRSAARQISSLVNSVVSFNQLGGDRLGHSPALLDVSGLCNAIAAEVESVWSAEHHFNSTIAENCGTAMLSEMLLRRIVENLLTNAFRYTPSGGTVTLRVCREKNLLCFEIEDTGIGIPEEDLNRISEPFYRSRNVEGRRGLGLGLSNVHDALLLMGGTVTVTTEVGTGTTMMVEIPLDDRGKGEN